MSHDVARKSPANAETILQALFLAGTMLVVNSFQLFFQQLGWHDLWIFPMLMGASFILASIWWDRRYMRR